MLVDELITRVDATANDLHPMMLNDLGLLSTLFQFFKRYTEQTQVYVHFRHAGLQQRFHTEIETTVYRIVHEALSNVARHSGAQEVSVDVWLDRDALNVHIVDSGSGFHVDQLMTEDRVSHLMVLEDRVSLLGGQVTIVSTPGEGTQITAHLPVREGEVYAPSQRQFNSETESTHSFRPSLSRMTPRSATPTTTSVVLVSSNELIRQGLRRLLETETQFSIVAEVAHTSETADMVTRFQPDVVILDWELGSDTIEPLTELSPQTYVLILSRFADEAYVIEALRQGAMGYVLRDSSTDELVQAIEQVAMGRRYLSPKFSERAIANYINEQSAEESSLDDLGVLTSREQEIFHLVIEGYKNAEIADQLFISPRTVETHRANMMRKLGLHSQTDLIRYAAQRGLIARDT
jgi:two-component system response regulator NreC